MTFRTTAPRAVHSLCLLVATVAAVGLAGANASAAPAPIKVGQLVTEGAAVGFPTTASRTLKGFFQDYNARGGLDGRQVDVSSVNDSFSAEKNVAGTKQLIDSGVVAIVGSLSLPNCLGNVGLLQQADLYQLGFGTQSTCFAMKQFGSVTASNPAQIVLATQYAKQHIGGKVCVIGFSLPGSDAQFRRADQMLAKLGTKFAYKNTTLGPTTDPTAALLEAKSSGCRSVLIELDPGRNVQAVNAKATQKIANMDLILMNGHDYKALKGTGKNGQGSYVFSQMYPFSNNDSRTKAYRRFCNAHNITPDIFSIQAYISAQLFVKALESIKGAVTRQSVGTALSKLDTKNSLLPGQRFRFGGQGSGNAPNVGGYMLRIENGKFVKAPGSEILLPRSVRSLAGK